MKYALLLPLLAIPFLGNAQIRLTSNGFVSETDSTKNYIVVEAPGISQANLYKKTLVYLSGIYVSPKEVMSTVDNESITVNAIAAKAIKMKVLYLNPNWDVNYTIGFQFKDGKIRIGQLSINKLTTRTGDIYRTGDIGPGDGPNHKEIYNKKGELKQKDAKEGLEAYFNNYIYNLKKGVLSTKQDNW
jgi:hypothetical protein